MKLALRYLSKVKKSHYEKNYRTPTLPKSRTLKINSKHLLPKKINLSGTSYFLQSLLNVKFIYHNYDICDKLI